MKKTLGGQRLGSGNKMQVDLHGFERSTHDLSYIWRSTMSAGTLVPFMNELVLPGDTFDIKLNCDIKTHPTIGPLFGSYKVQLDVFYVPIRLYHSALHNNRLGIGMKMNQIKLPKLLLTGLTTDVKNPNLDNWHTNPSSLLAYLGIRGVGEVAPPAKKADRKFNAVPFLAYWDIYKNYYANKQEEVGGVITASTSTNPRTVTAVKSGQSVITNDPAVLDPVTLRLNDQLSIEYTNGVPAPSDIMIRFFDYPDVVSLQDIGLVWTQGTNKLTADIKPQYAARVVYYWEYRKGIETDEAPRIGIFSLGDIDRMRDKILSKAYNAEFIVNVDGQNLEPYYYTLQVVTDNQQNPLFTTAQKNQEGLGLKTYQSDLFNNWLSTEWIDGTGGINEITAVSTVGDKFNIDALQLSKKVYDMLNRIAVSGGSYNDWLEAVYDHEAYNRAESPVYLGGLIKELVFQEVVSNAFAEDNANTERQPLGTLAGRGIMGHKHKGGTIICKADEPGYVMGIISLTPRLDYSQGNKWDVNLDTLDDLHKPSLDQIGFQELIQEQMAWWTTHPDAGGNTWMQQSAGKQPAWVNYMTNVNVCRGNFAIRTSEMFMTLNRRYTAQKFQGQPTQIKDLTTYIDPTLFNYVFADTSIDAQNFWAQISVDITARRKMSAKIMPNL